MQLISGDKFCIQIIKTNLDSEIVYPNVKLHLTYEFSCIKSEADLDSEIVYLNIKIHLTYEFKILK